MAFNHKHHISYFYQNVLVILAVLMVLLGGTDGTAKPSVDSGLNAVTGSPTEETGNIAVSQRPPPSDDKEQCVPFHHYYCSKFSYNSTISPNPWAHDLNLEQATREFDDFVSLFKQNCSEKLGTFLCFTYFPFCYQAPGVGQQIVLPCKETCEAVHSSDCNDIVLSSVGEWAQHLQCSKLPAAENGNCAEGIQQVWTPKLIESDNTEIAPTPTTPATTTEEVTAPVTTDDKKTVSTCEGDDTPKCKATCTVRERCTGGTLKTNNYQFIAKVVVSHKLTNGSNCKHAHQINVVQQFNLSYLQDGTKKLAYAPAMQSHITIHTSPSHCDVCPTLADGATYLIAGQYYTSNDGSIVWELPNGKSMSMVSEWTGRNGRNYNRKLEDWVTDANNLRESLLKS